VDDSDDVPGHDDGVPVPVPAADKRWSSAEHEYTWCLVYMIYILNLIHQF
jgi:hypothetical protein